MTTKKKQPTLKSLEAEIVGLRHDIKEKADWCYYVSNKDVNLITRFPYDATEVIIEDLVSDYERRRRRNKTLKKFLKACGIGVVLILATVGIVYLIKGGC